MRKTEFNLCSIFYELIWNLNGEHFIYFLFLSLLYFSILYVEFRNLDCENGQKLSFLFFIYEQTVHTTVYERFQCVYFSHPDVGLSTALRRCATSSAKLE